MFQQRRHSLRNLFGNGSHRRTPESPTKDFQKKQRNIFRQTVRDRKRARNRLSNCMEIMQKNWDDATIEYDKKDETYKVTDGNVNFVVSIPTSGRKITRITSKPPSLVLSTCVYTCASGDQSVKAVKKALKTNDILGASGNQGFKLSINSGSSTSPHDKSNLPTTIDLSCSRTIVGLFESTNDHEFFCQVKNFVDVTFRVRKRLESIFEGRLGMAPRDDDDSSSHFDFLTNAFCGRIERDDEGGRLGIVPMSMSFHEKQNPNDEGRLGIVPLSKSYISHVEFLTKPPSIVAQFLKMATNTSTHNDVVPNWALLSSSSSSPDPSLLSVVMADGFRPKRYKSTTKPRGILKKPHHISKSARKMLSQFSTPEEAKVFELYMRTKYKRKTQKKKQQRTSVAKSEATESTDASPRSIIPPKRIASLPVATKIATLAPVIMASPPPKPPPVPSDWNRTPLISNKKCLGSANNHQKEGPAPLAFPQQAVSERHLRANNVDGSTRTLLMGMAD